ncbi:MAG: phosphonate C-P lyase system protein PhnH [Pseudomonadota bacterium]
MQAAPPHAAPATALQGGFADAPIDAARAFRAIMDAMARPGQIRRVTCAQPPAPLSPAAGAVLLTLCDPGTKLHLTAACDTDQVRAWITFHTGAPLVPTEEADFALGPWEALLPLTRFRVGTSEYPDRSATLIVECTDLAPKGARLTGPGIAGEARLNLPDLAVFQANRARFPLGVDFLFTAGDRIAALPRSTQVEAG